LFRSDSVFLSTYSLTVGQFITAFAICDGLPCAKVFPIDFKLLQSVLLRVSLGYRTDNLTVGESVSSREIFPSEIGVEVRCFGTVIICGNSFPIGIVGELNKPNELCGEIAVVFPNVSDFAARLRTV
jgi:hypothetical protein